MTRIAPRALVATAVAGLAMILSGCEFMQFNIANGNKSTPENFGQKDIGVMVRDGFRPVAMTLEEVCGHRFWELAAFLDDYGYSGQYDNIEPRSCGGNGYGNAIFHLGHRVGWPGDGDGKYVLRYRKQAADPRHAMAVGIDVGGRRAIIWVTHLENGDKAAAGEQAGELLHAVEYVEAVSKRPAIVGGDFNLEPGDKPMPAWRNHFHEADGLLRATHEGGKKVDYLFSSLPWARVGLYPSNASDHHRLIGGF